MQLLIIILDFFIAGTETTSNTIDFALLMMLLHPNVQKRAQEQIDLHLDKDAEISYGDRLKLPYINAVILEVERYCYVIPIVGPRRVLRDTTLEQYCIPKDTTVLMNAYTVCRDPEIWGDPDVFRPERFIKDDGQLILNEKFYPFGLGRRRCIGEVLARSCVFIFFTGILRNFDITLPKGCEIPSDVPVPGIFLSPKEYKVNFMRRQNKLLL